MQISKKMNNFQTNNYSIEMFTPKDNIYKILNISNVYDPFILHDM